MILNSIIIDNIRSYEHEEIEFPQGISLFEGDIGSGKSTVLMAIEFALFGLGSQKPEALLSKRADTGAVILEFTVEGAKYEIKRALQRKSTGVNQDAKNSWFRADGQKELLSPSELKQRVLQILKFNEPADPKAESKIFRYAVFTPQEAMKEVLSNPRKRLETIRKAFGIEDYSVAAENSKELLTELKTRSRVLKERFINVIELENENQNLKKKQLEINQDIEKFSKLLETQKNDEEKIISDIKQLQEKENERIKIESKKENIEDKIESAEKQIQRIEDEFAEFESELKQNNEEFERLAEIKRPKTKFSVNDITLEIQKFQKINDNLIRYNSEKKSILSNISKLKETLGEKINSDKEKLESTLQELQNEKNSLERFGNEIQEKLEKIKSQQVEKQTLKASIEREIAKFSELGNTCPTCKQEIKEEHHHNLVDEKKKESNILNEELKEIADSFFDSNSKLKEITEKVNSYNKEIEQIEKILPGIEDYSAELGNLSQIEAKIKEIENSKIEEYGKNPVEYLSNLKEELNEFENATERMKQIVESKQKIETKFTQKQEEIKQLDEEIKEKEVTLKNVKSLLDTFENFDEKILELEEKQRECKDKIIETSNEVASLKESSKNTSEKISENNKKIDESKKWQEKYNIVSQYKEWLEVFFIPTIVQIEKQVLLSILQNFNETYTRWYSILVEDPTKESRIDENFTPIVHQDGYDQEIAFLSGGEKTSIALAYRLTLNSLIRKEMESMKSNLLILDEPTDGFSKNQLGKIRELLDELKSDQIVLVSHEKELETYVDNIFQISKQDGVSKISRLN